MASEIRISRGSRAGALLLRGRVYLSRRRLRRLGIRSKRLRFEGIDWHYLEGNSTAKRTIVFLHGFLDNCYGFRRLLPFFAGEYRVLAVDLPGFGESRIPLARELYDMQVFSRSLARLLTQAIGIEHGIVIAHSMGAAVAIRSAMYYKHVFRRPLFQAMHLLAPALILPSAGEIERLRQLFFPANTEDVRRLLRTIHTSRIPELPELILNGLLHQWSLPGYKYLADNILERSDEAFFTPTALRRTGMRAHVYWGSKENILKKSDLDFFRSLGWPCHMIAGAGHALPLEKDPALALLILEQLAGVAGTKKKR